MVLKRVAGIHYIVTFVALIVLATTSLLLSFAQLSHGGLFIALLLAAGKAILVMWFFMHLVEQPLSARMVVIAAVLLMALLISLTALDVRTRHTIPARNEPTESSPYQR